MAHEGGVAACFGDHGRFYGTHGSRHLRGAFRRSADRAEYSEGVCCGLRSAGFELIEKCADQSLSRATEDSQQRRGFQPGWDPGRFDPSAPEPDVAEPRPPALAQTGPRSPANPTERNFWKLLSAHRERIPDETYKYVFYIVSAAAIGENPKLFGFDFENPLLHLEKKE